jgi:hypothetical protein
MPELVQLENALWYLALLLKALLLYRLWSLNLTSRYRAFVIYLAIHVARSLFLMPLRNVREWYGWAYLFTEPLLLITYIFVVMEIHGQILEGYNGLSALGRKFVFGASAASALITVLTHQHLFDFSAAPSVWFRGIMLVESTVYSALMLFLLGIALFILWYPVSLRRNLLLYTLGFCLFLGLMTAGNFIINMNFSWNRAASTVREGAFDLCLLGWVILFRKSWEVEEATGPRNFTDEQRRRLLAQLDGMNRAIQASQKTI